MEQQAYSIWDLLKKILKMKFAELSDKAAVLAIKKMRNDQKMKEYEELIGILETQTVHVGFRLTPNSPFDFNPITPFEPKKESSSSDYSSDEEIIIPIEESSDSNSDSSSDDDYPKIAKTNRKTLLLNIRQQLESIEKGTYYKLWTVWDKVVKEIRALLMVCPKHMTERLLEHLDDVLTPANNLAHLYQQMAITSEFFAETVAEMLKESNLHEELAKKAVNDVNELWMLVQQTYRKYEQQQAQKE